MFLRLGVLLCLFSVARAAEVCCNADGIGCFNDNAPFGGFPLPTCVTNMNLRYTMFTRNNRNSGQAVTVSSVPSVYSPTRRTVFMAHGWNSNGNSAWLTEMKNAFLDREDINAVIVDWGGGAQVLNYAQAASNTRTVGAYTARVFGRILDVSGSAASRMWCVGHSLGAHMCGHTGMKMPTARRLGRVTGMDPAGPLFDSTSDKTVGINQSSGTFVDILHTDARGVGALGVLRDVGHIDFYPTAGSGQPGCFLEKSFSESNWNDESVDLRDACSHSRAYQFMIESIKRDCFHATQRCTNFNSIPGSCSACSGCGNFPCAYMGYGSDSSCIRSGMFYLTVRNAVPYCMN